MPLTLYVDNESWTDHLRRVVEERPGIVPVVKGNAYGFGMETLACRAQTLGVDTIAVGIYDELLQVRDHFDGDVLVMTPWRPGGELPPMDSNQASRVIHTVGRLADLERLTRWDGPAGNRPRVVIELGTSMRRHGIVGDELVTAATMLKGLQVEGLSLHLPLVPPGRGPDDAYLAEVKTWLSRAREAGLPTDRMFVSHLSTEEVATLAATCPEVDWRARVGMSLWVGDSAHLRQAATVVDVHEVERGDRTGYSQLRIPADGKLVVVAGGSSNGVNPESPKQVVRLARRARRMATSGTGAAGQWLSPFEMRGKQTWLSEPPHMQASSLFIPEGEPVPEVGDQLAARLDHASVRFDRVRFT